MTPSLQLLLGIVLTAWAIAAIVSFLDDNQNRAQKRMFATINYAAAAGVSLGCGVTWMLYG